MGKKIKRKKKRKLSKTIGILSFIVIIVVIILLALYQNNPQPIQKEKADKYFSFSEAFAITEKVTNNSIFISQVWFNITAVEGNATEVYIRPLEGGITPPEECPEYPKIIQGESEIVNVMYRTRVLSRKEDDGYPVTFRVTCHEAEGIVTIYVPERYLPP